MKSAVFALTLAALANLTACDKEKGPDAAPAMSSAKGAVEPAASVVAAAPVPAASTTTQGAPTAESIPVAADFEEEAEKAITKTNYRAELDLLEAELK